MALFASGNAYNTCLLILRERGFALRVEGELDPDGCYPSDAHWIAERGGFQLIGHNALELLGLVGIHDHLKPEADTSYWWRIDGPDLWTELMEQAFPDAPPPEPPAE